MLPNSGITVFHSHLTSREWKTFNYLTILKLMKIDSTYSNKRVMKNVEIKVDVAYC